MHGFLYMWVALAVWFWIAFIAETANLNIAGQYGQNCICVAIADTSKSFILWSQFWL